jgi:hypothetical protein
MMMGAHSFDPQQHKTKQTQVEARFRLATLAFLRRYDFPRGDDDAGDGEGEEGAGPVQQRLLSESLAHAQAAQVWDGMRRRNAEGGGGGGDRDGLVCLFFFISLTHRTPRH